MNQNKKYILVILGIGLVLLGLLKPDLSKLFNPIGPKTTITEILVEAPDSEETKNACAKVIASLQNGSNPKTDGIRLASLYSDISRVIELKENEEIIKTTKELAKVNSIAGSLLQLNLKDKYENLSESCNEVVKSVIGDEDVSLDEDLRHRAVQAFRNLAWACKEGSK
jgi:hypothetical protein